MNKVKRPTSVLLAGIVFWLMSCGTLVTHIRLAQQGMPLDMVSLGFAGLLLVAAFLWLFAPQSRVAFFAGAASLVACVIRTLLTASVQYNLRAEFPDIMTQVIGSVVLALLFSWLAFRFISGAPSRNYFQKQNRAD